LSVKKPSIPAARKARIPASQVHNDLGREGTPPLDLLAAGRDEVARYTRAAVA
jgi:hypothetical protein